VGTISGGKESWYQGKEDAVLQANLKKELKGSNLGSTMFMARGQAWIACREVWVGKFISIQPGKSVICQVIAIGGKGAEIVCGEGDPRGNGGRWGGAH